MNTLGRGAFLRAAALVTASSLALAVSATAALAEFSWDTQSGQSITVMMPEHPVTDGVRVVLDQFEADTGIDVNLQTMAEDLYFDRMEVALRGSGDTSQMDVYFLPMDSTAYTQHTNGLVHSLQGFIDNPDLTAPDYNLDDIPAGFLDSTKYDVERQLGISRHPGIVRDLHPLRQHGPRERVSRRPGADDHGSADRGGAAR